MFYILSFFIGLAMIPNIVLSQNTTNLACFRSDERAIDTTHCRRALQYIVYDMNGRLDSLSRGVLVWHRTCVININKPRSLQPKRLWIESTVQAITETCQSRVGLQTSREGIIVQVYRSTGRNVYQINEPICEKRTCNYRASDCLIAMNRLPVDHKGTFVAPSEPGLFSQSQAGNCTALIRTTDASAFRISHVESNPAFKRLLDHCGSRPGRIYISGGTEGNNGDVQLSTQGTSC